MRVALLQRRRERFDYDLDWRDAFREHRRLEIRAVSLARPDLGLLAALRWADVIVLLHSADPGYPGRRWRALPWLLRRRRGRLVYFPRNEFKHFSFKREFITRARVDLVATQLPADAGRYLYGDLAPVQALPHATNLEVFQARTPWRSRPRDLGSRTARYPKILLDESRNQLLQVVDRLRDLRPQWVIDYSERRQDRFDRRGWANFLDGCRFTISTEAGSPYLDRTDRIHRDIHRAVRSSPDLSAAELKSVFADRVAGLPSGLCVSSRHFEAIGAGTCQVLAEGHYNGILVADQHYIPLRADFSNLEEVVAKMEDPAVTRRVVENGLDLVRSGHTYRDRVAELLERLEES